MVVNFDLNKLIENNITPNQLTICYLIHHKNKQLLFDYRKYSTNIPIGKEIKDLIYLGFLQDNGNKENFEFDCLEVTELFKVIFLDSKKETELEDKWKEFLSIYPKLDGLRRLHDIKDSKKKFLKKITIDPNLFDKIKNAIEIEKEIRLKASMQKRFMPGWKTVSTYINQEAWTIYNDFNHTTNSNSPTNIYGGDIK